MKTTILSAVYGDYDLLKFAKEQSVEVDWVCVTDNPSWPETYNGWRIVYEPRHHLHPNRAAKTPKMLPWLYTGTETSIWVDASFRVVSSTFAEEALTFADPLAQFDHPWRQDAYLEARECIAIPKYAGQPFQEQMEHLTGSGFPENFGLWATGVIVRHHTPHVIKMGFDWMAEVYRYSFQDQVSHPYVCWKNGIRPTHLPGTHLANQWLSYEGSGKH